MTGRHSRARVRRRRVLVPSYLAGALATTLLLASCAAGGDSAAPAASTPPPVAAEATPSTTPTVAPEPPAPAAAAATPSYSVGVDPASITIPRMELTESLIPLGLESDGTMEVPVDYDDVGWFEPGGKPGGLGPTVIAGHVDSRSGPAVFYRLRELVIGDRFEITGVDGSVHAYEVSAVEDHAKAEFPTASVFGATMDDEVRLVTCGGEYDTSIGRYVDNLVVFAQRVA